MEIVDYNTKWMVVQYGASPSSKNWLTQFAEANPKATKLFIEELFKREVSLYEFWLVYVYSGTDKITDNLAIIDRLKSQLKELRPIEYRDLVDEKGQSKLIM